MPLMVATLVLLLLLLLLLCMMTHAPAPSDPSYVDALLDLVVRDGETWSGLDLLIEMLFALPSVLLVADSLKLQRE